MRAVIDTNCLLASIPRQSPHYWLYEAFRDLKFEWLISNEVLTEYNELLSSFYSSQTAEIVLSLLSVAQNVIYTEAYFKWNLITKDPDDNKFVDLAIAGNADYIVTNDKHFDVLKELDFPELNVVSLSQFREIILGS
ncbi:putative toxin-antitoxin system toxin component, PIN family [Mucilaginibacter sp. SMC90]|uniref:putative toxin-antitoxin system toxin component, PIN family n=1 Tax=Mucilaginibacter sp. SMC90 TaxID=2929803 RepID=UPI001FB1EB7C|nr:putative toxin-antitoxin system toxin component, PIN family [Mucilaginibacter sp. SMC90]UOE47720.1 putative toxin-antitoxin system toxin component, PIN family [Mucilaginibacter sp. SMC90]